jgi:SulP family sulfate permease
MDLETIRYFFRDDILPLWVSLYISVSTSRDEILISFGVVDQTIPLGLAILLRVVTHRFTNPLIFPSFFVVIPLVFYIVAVSAGIDIETLRASGWVFDLPQNTPWYAFYQLYGSFFAMSLFSRTRRSFLPFCGLVPPKDFRNTDFAAVFETIPTQLALVFFALLHVPINVPALALSIGEDDVKTDSELVNHGISNAISGLLGTVPNYLCASFLGFFLWLGFTDLSVFFKGYVNSVNSFFLFPTKRTVFFSTERFRLFFQVLFYRVGGTSRLASGMLAAATAAVMFMGPSVIGYLPGKRAVHTSHHFDRSIG